MTRKVLLVLVFTLAAGIGVPPAGGQPLVKKSLVIMLDGLRSDGLIDAATPNMDSLVDGSFGGGDYMGAYAYYAQTIQDAPTYSAYNHVSIMTGVGGAKHGVTANTAAAIAAVDYGTYPTYLSTLEAADPNLNTAFLATWSADLSMVTGADYDKDSTDAANVSRVVDILAGTFSDPSGDNGTSWTLGTDVDAIALFIDDIDLTGHLFGFDPGVAAYRNEIESVDVQIGQVLAAIQNRPTFAGEDWQIIVITDHGGLGNGHGSLVPNAETIPFIVASRSVSQGLLSGRVINYDTAASAIAHMLGPAAVPAHYDGVPRGDSLVPPPPAGLAEDLVLYLPFDGDTLDYSGHGNDAAIPPGSDHDPVIYTGSGKRGGYLEINDFGGGSSDSSYLTLGSPADLDFGTAVDFSIAAWFRAQAGQSGDPVILGNKDWTSGLNVGTMLLANENNGDDFGFNISDGTSRRDVEAIDYSFGAWWFLAASVDRDGSAVLFVGNPGGLLWVISDFSDDLGDVDSALPWNIGQDGPGSYAHNLDGDLDEMAVWRRALRLSEIRQLYNGGAGIDLHAAPAAITDLGSTVSGADLVLSWADVGQDAYGNAISVDHYNIYRGSSPYFAPGPVSLLDTAVSAGYTDSGAAGNVYYYFVTAVDLQGREGLVSNHVGGFSYTISP